MLQPLKPFHDFHEPLFVELIEPFNPFGRIGFQEEQQFLGELQGSCAVGRHDALVAHRLFVYVSRFVRIVVAAP